MLTRRFFLKSSGLALVSFGSLPAFLERAAYARGSGRRRKALVVVFQRGACDGLNVVIPHGERAYHALRPTIAVAGPEAGRQDATLDLDGFFGFHPALRPLLPLWKDGLLAAVHAVGSPDATRSHFDAQDFMESGTPGVKATRDGWMNRSLQSSPDDEATPFRAVSLTPTLPRSLVGRAPALAMANVRDFDLRTSVDASQSFEEMYSGTVRDRVQATGQETLEAVAFLRKADPSRYTPASDAQYPRGPYGESLRQIAQLLKADVGLELAFTEIGGWDHHAAEGGASGQLANRLRELGGAMAAFRRDLGQRIDDVLLVTLTEFGRTVRENGNRGTDHGHASVSLVMGGAVRGGKVHGHWPGLEPDRLHEGRDLALTTDFRDLLGEILARHLGVRELAAVFPRHEVRTDRFHGILPT